MYVTNIEGTSAIVVLPGELPGVVGWKVHIEATDKFLSDDNVLPNVTRYVLDTLEPNTVYSVIVTGIVRGQPYAPVTFITPPFSGRVDGKSICS